MRNIQVEPQYLADPNTGAPNVDAEVTIHFFVTLESPESSAAVAGQYTSVIMTVDEAQSLWSHRRRAEADRGNAGAGPGMTSAADLLHRALDCLWQGSDSEDDIIGYLEQAASLLGAPWQPPTEHRVSASPQSGKFLEAVSTAVAHSYDSAETSARRDAEHWLAPSALDLDLHVKIDGSGEVRPTSKRRANGRARLRYRRSSTRERQRLQIEKANAVFAKEPLRKGDDE